MRAASVVRMADFSSLDRKTVVTALDRLEQEGFIADSGHRVGKTKQVKAYRLLLNSTGNGCVKTEPLPAKSTDFSGNSPENGTRNLSEPSAKAKALSGPRKRSTDYEVEDWIPAEPWAAFEEMRRRKKKPLDSFTAKQLMGRLRSIRDAGWNVEDVITKAVVNCHDGFWMPDGRDPNVRRSPKGKAGSAVDPLALAETLEKRAEWYDSLDLAGDAADAREKAARLRRGSTGPPRAIGDLVGGLMRSAGNG